MLSKKQGQEKKLSTPQIIALGFFTIIIVGTFLLMLPISSRSGQWTNPLSAMFTATSATCVTGLIVVDTYQYWTIFGQIVIISLIQIGGLGFITFGVLFSMFMRQRIGLARRSLIQESVNSMQLSGVVKFVKKIVLATAGIELTGAVLLAIRFIPRMGIAVGIYNAVFHSISAFCNAGFDLMGRYEAFSSLTGYTGDVIVNFTIMSLILIGGLGFIVWEDLYHKKFNFKKYSLHTKIVVTSSIVLVIGGAILFAIFERNNLFKGMNPGETILASLFASVTPRTAGFNTIDLESMTQASKMLTNVFMFIGGCPGSTAGGVKTTSIIVMIVYIWSNLKNYTGCNIFGRRIGDEDIKKASMVIGLNLILIVTAIVTILAVQSVSLDDLLLEVFSAMGTVGLSTGLTRELTVIPKIVLIILMYCGRIGTVTFTVLIAGRKRIAPIQYPEEKINVG